jgi:hypothetical protein
LQEPYWKDWSHSKIVVEACYKGEPIQGTNVHERNDVADFLFSLSKQYKEEYGNLEEFRKGITQADPAKVGGILGKLLDRANDLEDGKRTTVVNGQVVPIAGWGSDSKQILDKSTPL